MVGNVPREGRNSAALHALRRQSYGEVQQPPLPPSTPGSEHSEDAGGMIILYTAI